MKSNAGDPWYVHAALYVVIAILSVLLIKIAIIDPKNAVEQEICRTAGRAYRARIGGVDRTNPDQ